MINQERDLLAGSSHQERDLLAGSSHQERDLLAGSSHQERDLLAGSSHQDGGSPSSSSGAVRTLVVWCPDWPVVAATIVSGRSVHTQAAVVAANEVVACSATARADGVLRGLRRRAAQARCPDLVVFEDDPQRDARVFEPVAAAVEHLAPGIEVVRPGLVAVPARGPAGYFGGEEAAAERIVDHVGVHAGVECQVGVADGLFAATLAAHRGLVVPAGGSRAFLAPLDVRVLDQPAERRRPGRTELVDLLRRLGLPRLGDFAALPERAVATRFTADAVLAHRLARGLEERPPARRQPPAELAVAEALDPPIERVDTAAFAARALAEQLHVRLADRGLACTRLGIHARTEHGEELGRVWRCAEPLTPAGTADRVRWQLDGWLTGRSTARPSAGITMLRLEPEEVISAGALQLGLFSGGDSGPEAERAGRALIHVQGLLGPDAVFTGVLGGGRGPVEQVRWVPWGDERSPGLDPDPPWPGRLPAPSPTIVPVEPTPAEVFDEAGTPVGVSGRHVVTAVPHTVAVDGGAPQQVLGWAGPWPVDERWWVIAAGRDGVTAAGRDGTGAVSAGRRARLQVVLAGHGDEQSALLLVREAGRWRVEGVYE